MAIRVYVGASEHTRLSNHALFKRPQLFDFSVQEYSTPIDPSDSSGGVGSITYSAPSYDLAELELGKTVTFEDDNNGTTIGTIRNINTNDEIMSVTADSRLGKLVSEVSANPYQGTFGNAFRYYLGLCGITSGIYIDATLNTRPVVFPGWEGTAWVNMKDMLTAMQAELALVSNDIILRPLRTREARLDRTLSMSRTVDDTNLARNVEVYYYNSSYVTGGSIYPVGGVRDDSDIQTVDAGDILEFDVEVNASLVSVSQPPFRSASSVIADPYGFTSGYTVIGNDGLPIPGSQWTGNGGYVRVRIGEARNILHFEIRGADTLNGPFSIGLEDGSGGTRRSVLRIVGTGVFYDKQKLVLPTGVEPERTPQEIGATIDNPYINTLEEAYTAAHYVAGRYSGLNLTISGNVSSVNKRGDNGSFVFATVSQANELLVPSGVTNTIDGVNAQWPTQTLDELNDYISTQVQLDFANQTYGNVAGARFYEHYNEYRIRSATTGAAGIQFDADSDTTVADANIRFATETLDDLNTNFDGFTLNQVSMVPLYKKPAPASLGYGMGGYGEGTYGG